MFVVPTCSPEDQKESRIGRDDGTRCWTVRRQRWRARDSACWRSSPLLIARGRRTVGGGGSVSATRVAEEPTAQHPDDHQTCSQTPPTLQATSVHRPPPRAPPTVEPGRYEHNVAARWLRSPWPRKKAGEWGSGRCQSSRGA